jgi:hypothetical protein
MIELIKVRDFQIEFKYGADESKVARDVYRL